MAFLNGIFVLAMAVAAATELIVEPRGWKFGGVVGVALGFCGLESGLDAL